MFKWIKKRRLEKTAVATLVASGRSASDAQLMVLLADDDQIQDIVNGGGVVSATAVKPLHDRLIDGDAMTDDEMYQLAAAKLIGFKDGAITIVGITPSNNW